MNRTSSASRRAPLTGWVRPAQIAGTVAVHTVRALPDIARLAAGGDRAEAWHDLGARTGSCLWHLGPAFVKVGQLMSTRYDMLPVPLCDSLQVSLAEGVGGPALGPNALNGSIAIVYRQARPEGDVAVKTRQPNTFRRLDQDLRLLELAVAAAERLTRTSAPLMEITRELTRTVRGQCDLEKEAQTLAIFERLETRLPVLFPRVLADESDTDTLTMTWIDGQYPARPSRDPRRTAKHLLRIVFEMLFVEGVVHCDLHPGNWWELADGRLGIVDAGFAYQLEPDMIDHFGEFFLGMAAGNGETCATHALAVCAATLTLEHETGFRRDMTDLVDRHTGRTAGDFSLAKFAGEFFAIQRRYGAYSRASFIFPLAALLAIEGQVKRLDPDINFQALSGPIVLRGLIQRARRAPGAP